MNIVSIRQKVKKAISKAPITVQVKRLEKVDDGAGGYLLSKEPTLVTECEGVLNNSSSGGININVSSGGIVNKSTGVTFLTVYEEGVEFKKGDFFTIGSQKYIIQNPVNILNLNIYWEIQLEQYMEG